MQRDATDTRKSKRARRLLIGLLGAVLFLLACGVALSWYVQSEAFDRLVKQKVIASIQDATGGRVELQSLRWNLRHLDFEATGLTVHGLEPETSAPLAQVDKLQVRARLISLFSRKKLDLTYLGVDRPQIHLIVSPDGKTNVPEPKVKSEADPVQQLFDLAISRAEFRDGLLAVNDQQRPFDFSASDLNATTTFDQRDRRYDGSLRIGKINAKYQDLRDVALAAETDFSVWQNRAQIKSLNLQSQGSSAQFNGTIENFNNPEIRFAYTGKIDLPQAAAIVRQNGIRRGFATIAGSGTYSADKYSVSGNFSARDVDYASGGSELRNATLAAEFQAANGGFRLSKIVSHAFGGEMSGQAQLGGAATGAGEIQMKLSGLSLAELAALLQSRDLPLNKLHLGSTVSGDVNLRWKGSLSRGNAEFNLDFHSFAQPAPEQLPVSGTMRGSYELSTGALELRAFQLSTSATHVEASGRIGRSAALNVSLATTNIEELNSVLNALGKAPLPVQLDGQASFKGTITGGVRAPEIAGHLQAASVTYQCSAPQQQAASQPACRRIHVDSFSGDIVYSPSNVGLHHATLTSSGARVDLDGSAALQGGEFVDASSLQLRMAIHNGDLSHLQTMIGTGYPVTGQLNASLQLSGTKASPQGHGSFTLTNATAYGRPIDSVSADANLQNDNLQFANLKLKAPGATVLGSGAYNLKTRQMLVDVRSDDIQLARVPEVQLERLTTAGVANLKLHASGTPESPVINTQLQIEELVLNDEHVGNLTLNGVTHDHTLVVTGRSDFRQATLTLDGTVGMQENFPAVFDLTLKNLDIDPFLTAELRGRITAHSGLDGHAHITGPLRDYRALAGQITIDNFHAEVEKVPVQSDGPIDIALANGTLSVNRFSASSADTRLNVLGGVKLTGDRQIHLQAVGSINAALFRTFDPNLASDGKADVNVRVAGTVAKPVIVGQIEMEHVSLSSIDLPAALSDMNGTLVFNENRLDIEKLTGKIGGGTVEVAGYIGYANGINFNLSSQGTDIRFRYSGISITANQQLKLQGTLKNATASGDITITRFAQIPSADLAAAFATSSPPIPNAASPLNNLRLDIHVRSSPELSVQTSLGKLSGAADLRVKGTALNPILLGRVNIAQGDLKINGQKYYLERGDLTFANPVRVDPVIDVEAKTRVRDFDITIGLHGTLERLSTTYRSDPPLSSEDIISLLAFGRTQQEYAMAPAGSGAGLGESVGNAAVGAAINGLVANRVSRLFGVSAIRINPAAGGGPDQNPNARLTVEQQVSPDVTITYITNLARSAQQVLQFEYNVTRDYTVLATRDENGVVSFDLLIRKRKK
jgi:translocation and assembly module TamB